MLHRKGLSEDLGLFRETGVWATLRQEVRKAGGDAANSHLDSPGSFCLRSSLMMVKVIIPSSKEGAPTDGNVSFPSGPQLRRGHKESSNRTGGVGTRIKGGLKRMCLSDESLLCSRRSGGSTERKPRRFKMEWTCLK